MQYGARLQARPSADVVRTVPAAAGQQFLDVGSIRDSYYYVPVHYDAGHPAPLALLLHGAGGHADHGLGLLRHLADEHGMILVAPASAAHTWDVIARQAFGPDVALLDRALSHVFARYAVDPTRLAIGGFSDPDEIAQAAIDWFLGGT